MYIYTLRNKEYNIDRLSVDDIRYLLSEYSLTKVYIDDWKIYHSISSENLFMFLYIDIKENKMKIINMYYISKQADEWKIKLRKELMFKEPFKITGMKMIYKIIEDLKLEEVILWGQKYN